MSKITKTTPHFSPVQLQKVRFCLVGVSCAGSGEKVSLCKNIGESGGSNHIINIIYKYMKCTKLFSYIEHISQCIPQDIKCIYQQHNGKTGYERQQRPVGKQEIIMFFDHEPP